VSAVTAPRRAVFLDRDGVLNDAAFELLPGAEAGCRALHEAGYLLLVVTNQPEVARGRLSEGAVSAVNDRLRQLLPLDAVYVCPHDDPDGCDCRKPLPGLLLRAAREWQVDLAASFMVGDRWKDVDAGVSAGVASVFVDHSGDGHRPDGAQAAVADLEEAARWILAQNGARPHTEAQRPDVQNLRIKLFADGANATAIAELARDPLIKGFTTNPTLMRGAGVTDYEAFAREVLAGVGGRPVSFEVFDDDFAEMERQALRIASWADNVYVKIPVTDTRGVSAAPLISKLAERGVHLNVTALLTLDQVRIVAAALAGGPSAFISVFAGRIADTGRDPAPIMAEGVRIMAPSPQLELIWASPRELLNIFQADASGCHIITVTPDLLKKLALVGKDLADYSLDTVKMFHGDARAAGYRL
jgi:transaldolase